MKSQMKSAMVALVPPSIRCKAFQAVLLFALLFILSSAALAQGTNCPPEPAQNTPIYDGEVYIGSNCNLYSPGDVDSFIFDASTGETYHLALGINGAAPVDICMTLYDPNLKNIFSQCTDVQFSVRSVVLDKMLATTGTYTIVVTETSSGTIGYALALDRLYPFSPDAQQIALATLTNGVINPITDSNEFTFASATTGEYEVSATVPGNASHDMCLRVYQPNGTAVQNDVCTNIQFNVHTINVDFTPTQNGMSMAFLYVGGNDGTQTYTMEASCLVGQCPTDPIPGLSGYLLLQGVPVANQLVGILSASPGGDQTTTTDQNGYYQFVQVPKGAYTVYAPIAAQDNAASAGSVHASPDK
jgi:hypothetical protein